VLLGFLWYACPKHGNEVFIMASSAYSIAIEDSDIVVRLNRNTIDHDTLIRFLDYLELEAIRKRSQLTDEQAAEVAAEIDRAVSETLALMPRQE
jgi:hypothetical protein